ncbi:MAG TPA: class I SAM-dependent methyltransferase, partial [Acidimicrobiales bacterium]|nr:class I SAM-dependent methyltransferase [Acidimicrobiales bacterium]
MHRYDVEIDASRTNNSHTFMLELIGANKRVLDVGCAGGYLAEALAARGCVVSGVEVDPTLAEAAQPHLEKLVVADVESCDLVEAFGAGAFDVVVFGDVLEHLRDPLPVLRQARPLLAPAGTVVASVPNVAHGSIRLALLQGRFEYQPTGLLDSTHLRFFTLDTLEQLLRDAGLVAAEVRRTTTGPFETTHALDENDFTPEIVDQVMSDPEALTYQFVLRAVLDDAGE